MSVHTHSTAESHTFARVRALRRLGRVDTSTVALVSETRDMRLLVPETHRHTAQDERET